jgi:hypothetical protein
MVELGGWARASGWLTVELASVRLDLGKGLGWRRVGGSSGATSGHILTTNRPRPRGRGRFARQFAVDVARFELCPCDHVGQPTNCSASSMAL